MGARGIADPIGLSHKIGIDVGAIHAQRSAQRTVRIGHVGSYLLPGNRKFIEGSAAARSRWRILDRRPVQKSVNDVSARGNTLVATLCATGDRDTSRGCAAYAGSPQSDSRRNVVTGDEVIVLEGQRVGGGLWAT